MDDDLTTYIPRRLNDPFKMMWFDAEAVLAFSVIFVFGIAADHIKLAALIGALAALGVQKMKSDQHPGWSYHWLRWHMPARFLPLRRVPPSHMREMIG
jgi:conjugal transfer pilus assembly protein TraL